MTEPASTVPSPVPPVAGGHVRASDTDRHQVGNVLDTAYAEGRLTRDEYDERVEALGSSRTFDDLVGLTRDLVVVAEAPVVPQEQPAYTVDTTGADDAIDRMVAVFSGTERKGKWRVRRRTESYALFGGIDLDMREAVFEAPVTEITGFWCFGGLDIKVPAGVEVRDQTMGVFGGTDVRNVGEPQPGAPVLVIKGMTMFGGVSVKGPKPDRKSKLRHRQSRGHCH